VRTAITASVLTLLLAGCGSSSTRHGPRALSQREAIESTCAGLHTRLKSIEEQNDLDFLGTLQGSRSLTAFKQASKESAAAVNEARTELLRAHALGAVPSLAEVVEGYGRFTALVRHEKPPTKAGGIRLHRIYSGLEAQAVVRCTSLGQTPTLE
jgi:hypothetical protein